MNGRKQERMKDEKSKMRKKRGMKGGIENERERAR